MQYEGVDTSRSRDGVRFVFWANQASDGTGARDEVGEMEVRFAPGVDGEPVVSDVWLKTSGPLTPTDLKRFAWDRWLRAAETIMKTPEPSIFLGGGGVRESRERYLQEWAAYHTTIQTAVGRTGRRGQDHEHYQQVARLYRSLLADGERSPVKRIAEDLGISRNTVSGWVAKARQLGYLPKGKQGRAG